MKDPDDLKTIEIPELEELLAKIEQIMPVVGAEAWAEHQRLIAEIERRLDK